MISNGSDSSGASVQGIPKSQITASTHDLGKETVQNIMMFRFANGMFEPLWNRDHIDHVQITVAEGVGVEKFSDATGALRDMVPNHLFQLLTLIAIEPPTCFGAEAVRSEKIKLLDAVNHVPRRMPGTAWCVASMMPALSMEERLSLIVQ